MVNSAWARAVVCLSGAVLLVACGGTPLPEVAPPRDLATPVEMAIPLDGDFPALPDLAVAGSPCDKPSAAWPMPGRDPQHRSQSASAGPQSSTVKWTLKSDGLIGATPIVAATGVIYTTTANAVLAVCPDGTKLWEADFPTCVRDQLILAPGGTLYAFQDGCRPPEDAVLTALDQETGAVRWTSETQDPGLSVAVAGTDGSVYYGGNVGSVEAMDPGGTLRWQVQSGGYGVIGISIGTDGAIVAVTNNGVVALDPLDGHQHWKASVIDDQFLNPAVALDGTIYVFEHLTVGLPSTTALVALNPADGHRVFTVPVPDEQVGGGPAVGDDGTIYFAQTQHYVAVTARGTVKWMLSGDHMLFTGSPIIDSNETTFVFGSRQVGTDIFSWPRLFAVAPDGALRWEAMEPKGLGSFDYGLNNLIAIQPALASDGTLYGTTSAFELFAIGP